MIKVEKDNVILSINESDLGQYEARGYNKLGAKKIVTKDLEKEVKKLAKTNEELVKTNEELQKKITELMNKEK